MSDLQTAYLNVMNISTIYDSTENGFEEYSYDFSNEQGYEDSFQHPLFSAVGRFLAPGDKAYLDYGVFSVVIATLLLVLVVEMVRHQLDVLASGNPFFKKVLELMYQELTTLGIVEFFIYLLHKYWATFNYALEYVFVDVHFMLFYTSVINALQSVLLRVLTSRRTDKVWLKTEDIDISHYVAIRKEFDRVNNELKQINNRSRDPLDDSTPDWPSAICGKIVQETFTDLYDKIRYPHLSRKKRNLVLPVRFHELRVHFIDSNNLPPKFKVSHYLKRSLTEVLMNFIHISTTSWIMLMASANLLYFVSGATLYVSEDSVSVTRFLIGVYLSMCGLFVVAAFVLYFKMRSVFSEILHMKLTVDNSKDGEKSWRGYSAMDDEVKAKNQLQLFWGGNPRFILVAMQYMQFGYALGLAFLLTYWKQIKVKGYMGIEWLSLILILSFALYSYMTAEIIPWYTMCTSMGQLVNEDRLNETLAKVKLSEEIQKKEARDEEKKIQQDMKRKKKKTERASHPSNTEIVFDGVHNSMGQPIETSMAINSKEEPVSTDVSNRSVPPTLASLSKGDTTDGSYGQFLEFLNQEPKRGDKIPGQDSEIISNEVNKVRVRSKSEGVSIMRSSSSPSLPPLMEEKPHQDTSTQDFSAPNNVLPERRMRKERRRIAKAQSAGVASMRSSLMTEQAKSISHLKFDAMKYETLTELVQTSAKELPDIAQRNKHKLSSRRKLSKTLSDGVSSMRSLSSIDSSTIDGHDSSDLSVSIIQSTEKYGKKMNETDTVTACETNADSLDSSDKYEDAPDADLTTLIKSPRKKTFTSFLGKINLAHFFKSSNYRMISMLCGPMVCFFLVAMRVESFNIIEGHMKNQKNTIHFSLKGSFWTQLVWYGLMIAEFLTVLIVFSSRKSHAGEFLFSCTAASVGIAISVTCLCLLIFAEIARCPEDVSECEPFGERTYGGLGSIEPFTSLIALSPLRFMAAWYVQKYFVGINESNHNGSHSDDDHHDHHGHHGPDPTSHVRELWFAAVGANRHFAKKYGIFSGEFLQVMLGIGVSHSHSQGPQTSKSTPNKEASVFALKKHISDFDLHSLDSSDRRHDQSRSEILYPKSRLVHSIRRCERKLLPLLDEWMPVDVVLTSHELIMFEVPDNSVSSKSFVLSNRGKGLKLSDVAKGRKVVGHFAIEDIDSIGIERRLATKSDIEDGDIESKGQHLSEFWGEGPGFMDEYDVKVMNQRWSRVDEDRLKIHFTSGTLLLRFVVDLIGRESRNADEGVGSNLWCATIARLHGSPRYLPQSLTHYGNDGHHGTDELNVFIEICDREMDDEKESRLAKTANYVLHRKTSS